MIKVNDELKEFYDNYYDSVESENEWRKISAIDKVQNIIDLSNDYPHAKILEIGSGEGAILKRLSELHYGDELYSLEISKSAIESINKKNIPNLMEVNVFDGYNIPYKEKEFNLIIFSHLIEHLEHPRKLLHEAARVSEYIFIEVPLEDTFWLNEEAINNKIGHINFYSLKTIKNLVYSCNLEILDCSITNVSYSVYKFSSGVKGIFYYLITQLGLISPKVSSKFLPYHCALICKPKIYERKKC